MTRNIIPTWKWKDINMNFVVGLPRIQRKYNSIWVVVDRFTKSAHFISVKSTYSAEDYARIFINEIVCRHGIPLSIISIKVHNSHLGFGGHSKNDGY